LARTFFRVIGDTDLEVREAEGSWLQAEASMPRRVLNILVENFEIEDDVVTRTAHRHDFSDWMSLHKPPQPHLKDQSFTPRTLWAIAHHDTCVFDEICEDDYLVHHPFDSFSAVEAFIHRPRRWLRRSR
jgi:polyphosphate kinase